MRRTLTVLAVLVVLIAVCSTAMAASVYLPKKVGELYIRPGGLPTDGSPVGMPNTTTGNNGGGMGDNEGPLSSSQYTLTGSGGSTPGPVSLGGSTRTLSRGTALVSPTGGSVYTPKQRADREIKGLIRRLR